MTQEIGSLTNTGCLIKIYSRGLLSFWTHALTRSSRFQVYNTISNPNPEWEGYEGRVCIEMLLEVLPPPPTAGNEHNLLICVCGPEPFTLGVVR